MNKKGFTLIELLAVTVILGIVLVIASPVINGVIESYRIDTFFAESQNVYRMAKIKAIDLVNTSSSLVISSNSSNKLDLDGNSLDYCVIINEKAEITSITVSNGKYIISGGTDFLSQESDEVSNGNMNDYICE